MYIGDYEKSILAIMFEHLSQLLVWLSLNISLCNVHSLVDSFLPKNMEELQAKVSEIPGKVMIQVGEVREKCVLQ